MNAIPGLLISDGDAGDFGDMNGETDDGIVFLDVFGVRSDERDGCDVFKVLDECDLFKVFDVLDDDVDDGICWYSSTSCASNLARSIASSLWDLVKGE